MGLSIGPKIGVEGADQFRAEFKEMVAISGELQSKMDALTASFSKYDSTLVNNKKVTQQLNDQIANQKTIVTSATEGYEMANRALEENQAHLEATKKVIELVKPSIEGMKQRVDEAKAAVEAQSEVLQEASQRVAEARERVNSLSAEYSAHNAELKEAQAMQKEVADAQALATKQALDAYREAEKQYGRNAQAQITAKQTIEQTTPQIEQQRNKIAELQATLEELNRKQGLFKAGQEAAAAQTRKNTEELGANATATRASRELRNEYTASAKANAAEIKTTSTALKDETKLLDKLIKSHDNAAVVLADSQSKEEALAEAVMKTGDAFFEESRKLGIEKEALDDINEAIEENKRLYGAQGEVTKELRQERDDLIETEKNEEKTLKSLQGEQEKQEGLLKDTKREVEDLEKELSSTEKKIDVGRETIAKWGDVMYTAKAKLEEFLKKLRETPNGLETFLGSVQSFGEGLADVGKTLTKYITVPLATLGTYGVKTASDFTDALAKISTIADTTKVPLETFRTEILRISDATGRSVEDISAATYQALSAAVDTEDAIEFVEGAANLARAGFLDMYGSVDVLTTILNSYDKKVEEVEHISDVLVKTQDMGKTTVDQLAQAMGNVIPMASQYGISLEDLSSAYVILTRQGINTARTTTYLRSAFTELEKEGSDASEALKEHTGKTFMQLLADGKNLGEIFQILRDSVGGDQEKFIHLFGSIRSGAGALALANTSAKEYNDILMEVSYSAGQTARNVQKLETPSLKWKRMLEQIKNSAMDLGQTILDILYPHLVKVADAVKNLTTWFKKLSPETKKSIVSFGGVAAAIPPVITGIGKMTAGIATGGLAIMHFLIMTENATSGIGLLARKLVLIAPYIAGFVALTGVATAAMVTIGGAINEVKQQEIEAIREQYKYSEALQGTMSSIDELGKSYEEYRKSAVDKMNQEKLDVDVIDNLRNQYNLLLDETGNVKAGNEELADFYLEGLAYAMGITIEDLKTQIEEHGNLDRAIDSTIEQMKREAQMAVYKEWLVEATRTQIQAQRDYDTALAESNAAAAVAESANERAQAAQEKWQQAILNQAPREEQELLRQEFEKLNEEAGIATAKADELKAAEQQASETLQQATNDINSLSQVIEGKLDPAENDLIESVKNVDEAVEETTGNIQENAEEMAKDLPVTGNLTFERYRDHAVTQLDEMHGDVVQRMDKIVGATEVSSETETNGEQFVDGYGSGISKATVRAVAQARRMARQCITAVEEETRTGSPSRVARTLGQFFGEGFALGIHDEISNVGNMSVALADAAMPEAQFTSNYPTFGSMGFGTTNNTRNISAPIAVNVNVNGNVDDPNGLADIIEQRLVEKIINNERAFA